MKNNKTAQLNSAYSKRCKVINKDFFINKNTGLVLFVEYLKYLRDSLILETPVDLNRQELTKTKIATLVTTIAEFETYKINQDKDKKTFHWNNFCELVKLNMEEWLEPNDSV
jgi:hypothetical protein